MKFVKMYTLLADSEKCVQPGSVYPFEDAEADDIIARGYGEFVKRPFKEKAVQIAAKSKAVLPKVLIDGLKEKAAHEKGHPKNKK